MTEWVFDYNGTDGRDGSQQSVALEAGEYLLECWGAEGAPGLSNTSATIMNLGGKGGYVKGEVTLESATTLYINVGGKNTTMNHASTDFGGWNGGGNGFEVSGRLGGGGGGASDIRISGTALANRVIVGAGGGGGGGRYSGRPGADGGGLTGANASSGGTGGTQLAGGSINGVLGVGGSASVQGAGGGGGGYYGGGASGTGYYGGGGGSSFYGDLANADTAAGVKTGHGQIKITLLSGPTPTTQKRRFAQFI